MSLTLHLRARRDWNSTWRAAATLKRWIHTCVIDWVVRRAMVELQALDDRILKDIGLRRCEIEYCVRQILKEESEPQANRSRWRK
jgi:uncharacterized protein YjiS (DUF1127 family)